MGFERLNHLTMNFVKHGSNIGDIKRWIDWTVEEKVRNGLEKVPQAQEAEEVKPKRYWWTFKIHWPVRSWVLTAYVQHVRSTLAKHTSGKKDLKLKFHGEVTHSLLQAVWCGKVKVLPKQSEKQLENLLRRLQEQDLGNQEKCPLKKWK
jgi:hypothetical protein